MELETLVLAKGGHNRREEGMCLLEAVAWFAGGPHTEASCLIGGGGLMREQLLTERMKRD